MIWFSKNPEKYCDCYCSTQCHSNHLCAHDGHRHSRILYFGLRYRSAHWTIHKSWDVRLFFDFIHCFWAELVFLYAKCMNKSAIQTWHERTRETEKATTTATTIFHSNEEPLNKMSSIVLYFILYLYRYIPCMSTCIFFVLSLCRLLDFCRKKYIYTHKKKNKYKINGIRKQTEFNIDQEQVAPSTHRHTFIWSYFNFIFAAFFGFYLFIYFSTSFFSIASLLFARSRFSFGLYIFFSRFNLSLSLTAFHLFLLCRNKVVQVECTKTNLIRFRIEFRTVFGSNLKELKRT